MKISSTTKTIFARILVVLIAAVVVYVAYLFVQVALAPVPVPPAQQVQKSVTFDTRLDVSKNSDFTTLRPLVPQTIDTANLGRANPFVPVPTSSAIAPIGVSSTELFR